MGVGIWRKQLGCYSQVALRSKAGTPLTPDGQSVSNWYNPLQKPALAHLQCSKQASLKIFPQIPGFTFPLASKRQMGEPRSSHRDTASQLHLSNQHSHELKTISEPVQMYQPPTRTYKHRELVASPPWIPGSSVVCDSDLPTPWKAPHFPSEPQPAGHCWHSSQSQVYLCFYHQKFKRDHIIGVGDVGCQPLSEVPALEGHPREAQGETDLLH